MSGHETTGKQGVLLEIKTPPAGGAGGVLEKIADLFKIENYLPASLVMDPFANPDLDFSVPGWRLYRISHAPTDMPKAIDQLVDCG